MNRYKYIVVADYKHVGIRTFQSYTFENAMELFNIAEKAGDDTRIAIFAIDEHGFVASSPKITNYVVED